MDALCRDVSSLVQGLCRFSAAMAGHAGILGELRVSTVTLQNQIEELLRTLDQQFDIPGIQSAAGQAQSSAATLSRELKLVKRRLRYQKKNDLRHSRLWSRSGR